MKKHRILSILLAAFLALPTPVFAAEPDDSGLSAYSEDESTESGGSGSAATSTLTATVDSVTYVYEEMDDGARIIQAFAEDDFTGNSIVIPEALNDRPVYRIQHGTFAQFGTYTAEDGSTKELTDTIISITLPSTLKECGASFEWLNNITEVKVNGENNYFVSIDNVLYWNESGSSDGEYNLVFYPTGNKSTNEFAIPETITVNGEQRYVTGISEHAFSDTCITDVDATYIRRFFFKSFCDSNVARITTSERLDYIAQEAFVGNKALVSLEVPGYEVYVDSSEYGIFDSENHPTIYCHKNSTIAKQALAEGFDEALFVYYERSYPNSTSKAAEAAGVAITAPEGMTLLQASAIQNADLTDGDYTTVCTEGSVTIDAGTPVHIGEIRILPDVYHCWDIVGTMLQASTDETNWMTIYRFERNEGVKTYSVDISEDNPYKFRYYRIIRDGGLNISELELWYDDGGIDAPTDGTIFMFTDAASWYLKNVTNGGVWCDDKTYKAAENGVIITGVFNAGETVEIPSYINGKPVTAIAPYAFDGCTQMKTFKVDDSENSPLTYILRYAFNNCTGLETVSLAKALRCVDGAAFEGCDALKEFRADWKPFTADEIAARASDNGKNDEGHLIDYGYRYVVVHEGVLYTFGGTRLTKYPVARSDSYYSVLDGTLSIGGYSLSGATNLKKVDLPQSVWSLDPYCFMGSGIESITLPYELTNIQCGAFLDCANLKKVIAINDVNRFAAYGDGGNINIGWTDPNAPKPFAGTNENLEIVAYAGGAWETYCADNDLKFTESRTVIWFTGRDESGYYDYKENEYLITGLLAPKNAEIKQIPSVTNDGKTIVGIGTKAFCGESRIRGDFKLPDTIRFTLSASFAGTGITSINIPKNLVNIWEGTFADCSSLTRFTVDPGNPYYRTDEEGIGLYRLGKPENLDDSTFIAYAMGCTNESYTLPKEAFAIGFSSFVGASNLKNLVLGNTLGQIRGNGDAFIRTGIENLTIPYFTECDLNDFHKTYGDGTEVNITVTREDIGTGKYRMRYLHDGTLTLEKAEGFSEEVVIPEGVEIIRSNAFETNNEGVTDIYLPSTISIVDYHAFDGCGDVNVHSGIYTYYYYDQADSVKHIESPETTVDGLVYRYDSENRIASVVDVATADFDVTDLVIPETVDIDGVTYTVKAIGEFAFAKTKGNYVPDFTSATIPDTVTHIGSSAFDWQTELKTAHLSNSLESIGWSVFNGCLGLESYTMDGTGKRFTIYSVDENGGMAIYDTERKVLSNYTRGSDAATFTMPSDMKEIEGFAFAYSKLVNLTIPEGVISLGDSAFAFSEKLCTINLPSTLLETHMAFTHCPALVEINVSPNSFNHYGKDGALYRNIYNDELRRNDKYLVTFPQGRTDTLENHIYTVEDGVDGIYYGAFSGNTVLTGVIIPDSVKVINDWAFGDTQNLYSLSIPDGCHVDGGAFDGINRWETDKPTDVILYISDSSHAKTEFVFDREPENYSHVTVKSSKEEFEAALLENLINRLEISEDGIITGYNGSLSKIDLSTIGKVTGIGDGVFSGVNAVIILTDTIETIGERAFAECPQIDGDFIVDLLEKGVDIAPYAFEGCTGVETLNITAGVTRIDEGVLSRLTNLKSITVDKNNTSFTVKDGALYTTDGKRLIAAPVADGKVSFTIQEGTEKIDRDALYGYSTLVGTLKIPASVESIGEFAFAGLSLIESFSVADGSAGGYHTHTDSADEVGSAAALYQGNTLLYYPAGHRATSYTVAEGTTIIGDYAFAENRKLTEVILPETVGNIGHHAFKNCSALRSVNLPDSLMSIGSYAFEGCSSLISAQIPEKVTRIEDGVFLKCTSLLNVTMPAVTTVNSIAFAGCSNLTKVDMPAGDIIGANAFADCTQLSSILFGENPPTEIDKTAFTNCDKLVVYYPADENGVVSDAWNAVLNGEFFMNKYLAKSYTTARLNRSNKDLNVSVELAPDSTSNAESVTLNVSAVTTAEDANSILNQVNSSETADDSVVYEISLTQIDEETQEETTISELDKPVLVKLPLPDGVDKTKLVIVHKHGEGVTAEYSLINDYYFVTEGGTEYVCFKVSRFSEFYLTYSAESEEPPVDTDTYKISGSITSYLTDDDVTVTLLDGNRNVIVSTTGTNSYSFEGIESGTYTLVVSKTNHVNREYEVTVGTSDTTCDVKICPIGDVNGDGSVTGTDRTKVLRHIKKVTILSGYELDCADVNSDGEVTGSDSTKILRHVKNIMSLWA